MSLQEERATFHDLTRAIRTWPRPVRGQRTDGGAPTGDEYEGAHTAGVMFADTHRLILRGISQLVSWFFTLWYKDSSQFRLFIPICLGVLGYAAISLSVVPHQSFYPNVLSNIVCVRLFYLVMITFQVIPSTFIQNMIYG